MKILPLHPDLLKYLERKQLEKKFLKQKSMFEENHHHPGLNTELLEPKQMKIYSFRLDKKYRAIFVYTGKGRVEIIDINPHYND